MNLGGIPVADEFEFFSLKYVEYTAYPAGNIPINILGDSDLVSVVAGCGHF
jgi:hypothetical protein